MTFANDNHGAFRSRIRHGGRDCRQRLLQRLGFRPCLELRENALGAGDVGMLWPEPQLQCVELGPCHLDLCRR